MRMHEYRIQKIKEIICALLGVVVDKASMGNMATPIINAASSLPTIKMASRAIPEIANATNPNELTRFLL